MAEAVPPNPAHPPPPRPPAANTHQLPPHPAAAQKRKLDAEEFKQTSYYKIRTIVRDLRASFLEACTAPDLQNSKAVDEIQTKLKTISELYRLVGTERASSRSFYTSSTFAQDSYRHQQQQQIPTQPKTEYKLKTNFPSEALQHKSSTRSPEVPSSVTAQPGTGHYPPKPAAATSTNTTLPGVTGVENALGGVAAAKGTYIVGGSPLGMNYVAYHTSAAPIYSGMTKVEWLAKHVSVAATSGTTTMPTAATSTAAADAATTSAAVTSTAAADAATTSTAATSTATAAATTTSTAAASSTVASASPK